MKELIGKTVVGLKVDSDQSHLVFEHPDGSTTIYETYGDCCSETWFADITGVSALLGQEVLTAEEVELPADIAQDARCRQEEDSFYGVKLTTAKGYIDIVYRNSSNGYYGGSIEIVHNWSGEPLTSITDDWQAGGVEP